MSASDDPAVAFVRLDLLRKLGRVFPEDVHASLLANLATNIRAQRRKQSLTQEAAAERCGLGSRQLQALELEDTNFTAWTLARVAHGLGVHPARLLDNQDLESDVDLHHAPQRAILLDMDDLGDEVGEVLEITEELMRVIEEIGSLVERRAQLTGRLAMIRANLGESAPSALLPSSGDRRARSQSPHSPNLPARGSLAHRLLEIIFRSPERLWTKLDFLAELPRDKPQSIKMTIDRLVRTRLGVRRYGSGRSATFRAEPEQLQDVPGAGHLLSLAKETTNDEDTE